MVECLERRTSPQFRRLRARISLGRTTRKLSGECVPNLYRGRLSEREGLGPVLIGYMYDQDMTGFEQPVAPTTIWVMETFTFTFVARSGFLVIDLLLLLSL